MKKTILAGIMGALALNIFPAAAASLAADSLTAQKAFTEMPAKTLDILTTSMRLDLLDYYNRRDSIYEVENVMEGLSHLVRPVSDEWLQAQLTPVTRITIRILPGKKGLLALSIYTVGDSLQAPDSEIRFYDSRMRELNPEKYIKTLSSKDFFNFKGVDSKTKKELLDLVPFPTVEYYNNPDDTDLHARLTVGEFLGKETLDKIAPYLRRERVLTWNGSRFNLAP